MSELKPCPFCGGKAELLSMGEKFTVSCGTGGCMASISWCPDDQSAIAAWNTRASDWIPCSERMPSIFDTILLAILSINGYGNPAYYVTIGGLKNNKEFESYTGEIHACETVTHWMPLPEPPGGDLDA